MVAVQNRPAEPTARPPAGDPSRSVHPRRTLPGSRAVVGGLLVAVAALGIFATVSSAGQRPKAQIVVAARDLTAGTVLKPEMLREIRIELPPEVARHTFRTIPALEHGVLLAPVSEGEFIQGSNVGKANRDGLPIVSLSLPAADALNGAIGDGDRVDVYATSTGDNKTDATKLIVPNVLVVSTSSGGSSIGAGGNVTVTLGIRSGTDMLEFVDATKNSKITLVRTTGAKKSPGVDSTNGEDTDGDGTGDGASSTQGGN